MSNKVQIHRFLVVENAAIIIQLTSCDVTCIQRPAVEFWGKAKISGIRNFVGNSNFHQNGKKISVIL